MRLVLPGIYSCIELGTSHLTTVVVENPALFYTILADLSTQMEKKGGEAVFSINDKPQDISKTVRVITDFWSISTNSREIINKIIDRCAEEATAPDSYEEMLKLITSVEDFVGDILWKFDLQLEPLSIPIKQVFKMADIRLVDDGEFSERLYNYVCLNRDLLGRKLFIFVNLRSFMSAQDLEKFSCTLQEHDIIAVYLENKAYPLLPGEERLIIDEDLCEI